MSKEEKVNIPEDLQQICRELAEVAIKHDLIHLDGKFSHRTHWGGEISFTWNAGRHFEDHNSISISTHLFVNTKVKMP